MTTDEATLGTAPQPFLGRLVSWVRSWSYLGSSLASGFAAGFIFAGLGTRLAMRITALMAGPEMQGHLTEAEAVVGQITSDGTGFLVMFGTMIGGVTGGFTHAAVRPWLPERRAGIAVGIIALAIGATTVIDADNFDFATFGVPIVNVAMYVFLFLAGGIFLHSLYVRVARRGPVVRLILGLLAMVLVFPSFVSVFGLGADLGRPDPRALIVLLIPLSLVLQVLAARRAGVSANDVESWMSPRLLVAGRLVGIVATAVGLALLAVEVFRILTA